MEPAAPPNPFVVEAGPGRQKHAADVLAIGIVAFVCALACAGFVVAFAANILEAVGWLWPLGMLGSTLVVVVFSVAVAVFAAIRYDRRPDSLKNWMGDRASLDLERGSLALMLWAIDQPGVTRFPSEPTMWTVAWRADLFGMHVEVVSVRNAANTVLHAWDFEKCPEGLRHHSWPAGPRPLWQKDNRRAFVRAAFERVTAHQIFALRAALNPL